MKKKILFCLESLNCGGIETSAITFLRALNSEKFDVTLCLNRPGGDLLTQVPKWIKVQVLQYGPMEALELTQGRKAVLRKLLSKGCFLRALRWILFGIRLRMMTQDVRTITTQRRRYCSLPNNQTLYDIAICYSELTQIQYVADFVQARCKAVWAHTELSSTWSDVRAYLSFFSKMDYIFCVSPSLTESYKTVLHECIDRIREFRHVVDSEAVKKRALEEEIEWPILGDALRILSVGRLAWQKGFDLIPKVASLLKLKGLKFLWYIIGEGDQRDVIQSLINQCDVDDCVKLLGKCLNPFPYYMRTDVYVQPSRYEGYCLTVAEARVFAKPIIATDFNGAREQLKDGRSGVIVPCDVDSLAEALESLIKNEKSRNELVARSNSEFNENGINTLMEELLGGMQ